MTAGPGPEPRRAARVLCVDPDGAVLLLGGVDPARPEGPVVWLPPGGGVEPGEDDASAALRELFEETGLWLDEAGPVLGRRRASFSFAGRRFAQDETWFAVRTPRFAPVPVGWSDWERASLRGSTWWRPGDRLVPGGPELPPAEVPEDVARLAGRAHRELGPAPVRPTVRVLVVDDRDRCVLLGTRTDAGQPLWYPPGGGLEPGETPPAAAVRELREELGLVVEDVGPCVWRRRHVLPVTRHLPAMDLRERWHLLRVPTLDVDMTGWTDLERVTVEDVRWWTADELAATGDLLVPRALPVLLPRLLADLDAGRPPAEPLEVGP